MEEVILVIHLILALAIIGLVLLQRSEGGGLGIGGGGGGLGNVASAKSMGNVLTKATTFCAIAFFCTSLLLGVLAGRHSQENRGILDALEAAPVPVESENTSPEDQITAPTAIMDEDTPAVPKEPPAAPLAE